MSKSTAENKVEAVTGLALMRMPFKSDQISKLPKPTRKQTDEVKADYKKGIRCGECGGWHHPNVVHLDYVGHAALTNRLLDCDPEWNWEPVNIGENGAPELDKNGGMWIKLTVCGVTRLGYGHPDNKSGGDAVKETIGDCLRNAAMRFGAALDLWHKGDLHADNEEAQEKPESEQNHARALFSQAQHDIRGAGTIERLREIWRVIDWDNIPSDWGKDLNKEKDDRLESFKAAPVSPEQSLNETFPGDLP